MTEGYTKGEWAIRLKQDLGLSKGLKVKTEEYKLDTSRNVGFGYYFPEHIQMRGEHYDYYSKEFAALVSYVFNNLEDIVEGK